MVAASPARYAVAWTTLRVFFQRRSDATMPSRPAAVPDRDERLDRLLGHLHARDVRLRLAELAPW